MPGHKSSLPRAAGIALFCSIVAAGSPASALTLQEGLSVVTEQGRDASIGRADVAAARSAVSLSRSPYLPTVDLYARETWLLDQPAVKTPSGSFPMSQDQYLTYGFKATQVLYDFGKTGAGVNSAEFGLKAREADAARTRNRAALEFVMAYYDLLEGRELLKVAQEEVTRYESHRRDAEARWKAGVVTRNEVLQTDVLLADSRQRLVTAENSLSLRSSRVNSLLMRPLNDAVEASEIVGTPALPATLDEAWAAAEKENPALRDLDARISAREESTKAVRAEYLPTVYLSGGYEYGENRYQVHESNWMLVAGVNMNLFAGGATDARIGMVKSEAASMRYGREKLLDAVRLDVKSAWLELDSSKRRIEVAYTALGQAQENLRLQRLRYQEGVGTATDVLDAVTLMSTAETNAWKANFGLKRAEAALLYSMGRDLATAYPK